MSQVFAALLRGLFMLAAGVLVLSVAAMLLMFTLAFILFAWVRGVLTGQRSSLRGSWAQVQRSAASTVWQRYRQQTGWSARSAGGGADASAPADVVDVDFREVSSPHRGASPDAAGPAVDVNHRLER